MVRVGVYFFKPQHGRIYNNSSGVVSELPIEECHDVNVVELPVPWVYALKKIKSTLDFFDVIVAVGENHRIENFGVAEMIAKKKETVRNKMKIPPTKYIKQNHVYDESNNYTCNDMNYYFLKRKSHPFIFFHVPTKKNKNKEIAKGIMKIIKSIPGTRVHKLNLYEEMFFERGYTNVKNPDCTKGILFPFNYFGRHSITMANTYFNLDILFLDKNNKILTIKKGKKLATQEVAEIGFKVVEMPHPYCRVNNVFVGDIVDVIPLLSRKKLYFSDF